MNSESSLKEHKRPASGIRTLLPKLLDQYALVGKQPGKRQAENAWVERMSQTIYGGGRDQAADAVASADRVGPVALELLRRFAPPRPVRLLGVRVAGLELAGRADDGQLQLVL